MIPIDVQSVLVFVGSVPDIKKHPPDVKVIARLGLRRWLKRRKDHVLSPDNVDLLAALATEPTTWFPNAKPPPPPAHPSMEPSTSNEVASTTGAVQAPDAVTPAVETVEHAETPPAGTVAPVGAPGMSDAPPVRPGAAVVRPWKRYGHDRLYVNGPDGERLGWLDRTSGAVHLEDPAHAAVVRAALAAWEHPGRQ